MVGKTKNSAKGSPSTRGRGVHQCDGNRVTVYGPVKSHSLPLIIRCLTTTKIRSGTQLDHVQEYLSVGSTLLHPLSGLLFD